MVLGGRDKKNVMPTINNICIIIKYTHFVVFLLLVSFISNHDIVFTDDAYLLVLSDISLE